MTRRSERAEAYTDFLRLAHADVRLLRIAIDRFAHGVPEDEEARKMIEETAEIVVGFNAALNRVEIIGSEETAHAAKDVAATAADMSQRLRRSYLSGEPVELEAGMGEYRLMRQAMESFAVLCRRELDM